MTTQPIAELLRVALYAWWAMAGVFAVILLVAVVRVRSWERRP